MSFKRADKSAPPDLLPGASSYKLRQGNGKGDMRGSKITVLSEQGRSNYDEIFRKKTK